MITGFVQGQRLRLAQNTVAAEAAYSTARFIYETREWLADGLVVYAHFKHGEAQSDYHVIDGEIPTSEQLTLSEGRWEVWLTGHEYDGGALVKRITTDVAALIVKPTGFEHPEPLPVRSFGESILGEVQEIYKNVADEIQAAAEETSAQLEAQDEQIAAQLEAQNEAIADQLTAQGEAITAQLAAQNEAVAAQLRNQNTAIAEQIAAQNTAVTNQLADQNTRVTNQLAAQNTAVDNRLAANEAIIDAAFGGLKNWRDGTWLKLWAGTEEQYEAATKSADTIYFVDCGLEGGPAPAGGGDA